LKGGRLNRKTLFDSKKKQKIGMGIKEIEGGERGRAAPTHPPPGKTKKTPEEKSKT